MLSVPKWTRLIHHCFTKKFTLYQSPILLIARFPLGPLTPFLTNMSWNFDIFFAVLRHLNLMTQNLYENIMFQGINSCITGPNVNRANFLMGDDIYNTDPACGMMKFGYGDWYDDSGDMWHNLAPIIKSDEMVTGCDLQLMARGGCGKDHELVMSLDSK